MKAIDRVRQAADRKQREQALMALSADARLAALAQLILSEDPAVLGALDKALANAGEWYPQ